MNALVGLLSLLGIMVGLISVAVPLRFLKIHSRRIALMVVATCSATFFAAVALDGPARAPAESAKAVSASTQQALASSPVDDGCQLAGALPNCKEEVAKIAAAKAANPSLFSRSGPSPTKQTNGSNSAPNYVDDVMNKLKASEASANVKALAAQREYDAAKFRSETANNRFESAVKNYDTASQRYKLESDSRIYDLRIQERERERQRRGY
jgi:hypothetical protein